MELILFPAKEFYFIRHGQTDYNCGKLDEPHSDLPLNAHGRGQAEDAEPLIAGLPIRTVCHSPLKRAIETKRIITRRLCVNHIEIQDLAECSLRIWQQMQQIVFPPPFEVDPSVQEFIDRVQRGISRALQERGPVLIVAHGGVHFALCSMIGTSHNRIIDHCVPIHFFPHAKEKKWIGKVL